MVQGMRQDGLRERRKGIYRSWKQEEKDVERAIVPSHRKRIFWLYSIATFCVLAAFVFLLYGVRQWQQQGSLSQQSDQVDTEHYSLQSTRLTSQNNNDQLLHNDGPQLGTDLMITIYSYDRPRFLLQLLKDLQREAHHARKSIHVHIIDDNSLGCTFRSRPLNIFDDFDWKTEGDLSSSRKAILDLVEITNQSTPFICPGHSRFAHVLNFVHQQGWKFFIAKHRHARRRYWHLVHMANSLLRNIISPYYFFLPDDIRLSQNFFPSLLTIWDKTKANNNKTMTLMIHHEATRANVSVWTPMKPQKLNKDLYRIGWVESGNFLCDATLLQFLKYSFPRVLPQRWINNPPISSGVGAVLSQLLYDNNYHMYRTDHSYVAHLGIYASKMNAAFRDQRHPSLSTRNFIDGEHTYQNLLQDSYLVTASLATKWTRLSSLQPVINSLSSQVDHLNVYLNDYDSIPPFLQAPYITVLQSQTSKDGDLGDIGKFYWMNDIESKFHLTVDDDIVYPEDYVEKMVRFLEGFEGGVAVGVHGIRLKEWIRNGYYGSREVYMGVEKVEKEVGVHILGTGTMLYRAKDLGKVEVMEVFREPNMADVWFGILAQRLGLPLVVIPHEEGWLKEIPGTFEDSLYRRFTRRRLADRLQTRAVKSVDSWIVHTAKKKKAKR